MIYFAEATELGFVKIGYSFGSASARIASWMAGCPSPVSLVCEVRGGVQEEKSLHRKFTHLRVYSEWFRIGGEISSLITSINAGQSQDERERILLKSIEDFRLSPKREILNVSYRRRMTDTGVRVALRCVEFETVSQSELADVFGVSQPAISTMIKRHRRTSDLMVND